MRLLIVDDDEVDRMAVVRILEKSNAVNEIMHASTANIGLKLFEENTFDAVLLDYCLPDMDCLDVLSVFTQHASKHAAILILTGMVDSEALETQCIVAGAQDFLLKQELSQRHLTKALLHAKTRHELHRQLRETHGRLKYLAENDPMTGLSNRSFFEAHLRAEIHRATRVGGQLGLLFLDIDNFKLVNDSLGHDMGDQLLQQIAQRLSIVMRDGDIVCRLGGDEFAVIVHDMEAETSIGALAKRILDDLRTPILLGQTEHFVTCSIGIATFPTCAQTAEDMLKKADLAMYHVKHEGRNGFHFFTQALQEQVQHRIMMESELRSQRLQSQLALYYQPVIDARTFEVCGAEMLVRWRHPTRGLLLPDDFLQVVEDIGFMGAIDTSIRRLACRQLAQWRTDRVVDDRFELAINASEQILRHDDLHSAIKADLDEAGLPGACLTIEVTEGVLVSDFEKTAASLNRIKALGLKVAIDDFGTGYSSMAYLKWLPATILKVDRSFVQNVPQSEADGRVLKAILVMAKSLGLNIVVEGVQTIGQARFCRKYGADRLQGFFFSRPLPADEFAAFVKAHNPQSYRQNWLQ